MYIKEHIDLLNEWGMLTSIFLARKYKYSNETAKNILESIVKDYENVQFLTPDQICIEGREPIQFKGKPKKISKWKNVKNP